MPINKHQSECCFDNARFSGNNFVPERKKKIWCCVDGLCIVLKSEGHPEGDPINMIRTEAFLCLVSIHSGMKYVKPSLDSLNTHTIWCRICVNQNNIYFYVRSLLLSEFFVNYSYNYLILQP